MVTRLQRYYGGDPFAWLRMPLCVLQAYIRMLPRLEAQDALTAVVTLGVGTGSVKKEYAQQQLSDWRRRAQAPGSRKVSEQQKAFLLKSVGISVG